MDTQEFKDTVKVLRKDISALMQRVSILTVQSDSEVAANLTLVFRHLEDAGMRLGKAVQVAEDKTYPLACG